MSSPGLPLSPAFFLPNGTALTNLTLTVKLLFGNDTRFTLHSLRRGAVQACVKAGLGLNDIKEAGPWSSDAYKVYLSDKVIKDIPSALGSLLG